MDQQFSYNAFDAETGLRLRLSEAERPRGAGELLVREGLDV